MQIKKGNVIQDIPSIKKVQRGTTILSDWYIEIPISPIDVNSSIILISTTLNTSGSANAGHMASGYILDSTTIAIEKLSVDVGHKISWQVIEFSSAKVQRGTNYLMSPSLSSNVAISSVNLDKSLLVVNYMANPSVVAYQGAWQIRSSLSSDSTIIIDRSSSDGMVMSYWQVIEID